MPNIVPLQARFASMNRDIPRDQLGNELVYNAVDWIPELDAPLSKRGGWSYASNDISATTATAAYTVAGAYVPFVAAAKNCTFDEDGRFYTIASDGTVTDVGSSNASTPIAPLAFHREKLIITRGNGTTAPGYYDGTTLGALAGSPPACKFSAVYKDRTVLSNSSAQPNRNYFSGPGDPTSWDTTSGFVDTSFPVTGIAALQNTLLIFSAQRLEAIRGSTPPPASDMYKETLFEPGCVDARSIVFFDDNVVFANQLGIFITNGSTPADVTERCGFLDYWRTLMAGWASTWTLAAGRHREWYVLSVMDGSTFKDAFLIDPQRGRFVRVTNLKTLMFWNSIGAPPQLFWANRAAPRVNSGESMWNPAAGVKNDADGTAVAPVLETGWFKMSLGLANARAVQMAYDLRDAATDNPVLTLSYIDSPEETSYTAVTDHAGSGYTLPETSAYTLAERKLHLNNVAGFALKVAQTNASATTRLFGFNVWADRISSNRLAA